MALFVILVLAIVGAAWNSSSQRACRIDPLAVDLGHLPEEGVWAREFNVGNLDKIVVGPCPEDLACDSQGRIYTGTADGWIKRIGLDGTVETHTDVGGTVLGLAVGPEDEIYYIDPDQSGIVKVSNDGVIHLLSNEVDGTRILFADGVVVAKDGTVYFTDVSTKFGYKDYPLDLIEARQNGRVLKYNPSPSSTSVLVMNMSFPNGVALSENEEFLLICETSR